MGIELNPPEKITPDVILDSFNSGKSALDEWLKKHSLQAGSGNTATTFVVTNKEREVVGYYSLSTGSISQEAAADRIRKGTARYEIPVILLARLAVDESYQRSGVGRALLRDAVIRVVNISLEVGVRAILTHPIDAEAANFYLKYGFERSPIPPDQLMILLKDARKALGITDISK